MTETPYFKDIAPPAYLVLIDGPAAREVGAVFREGLGPYPPEGTFGRTPEEVGEAQQRERWCDEVREYDAVFWRILKRYGIEVDRCDGFAEVLRNEFGEEILCDQVLHGIPKGRWCKTCQAHAQAHSVGHALGEQWKPGRKKGTFRKTKRFRNYAIYFEGPQPEWEELVAFGLAEVSVAPEGCRPKWLYRVTPKGELALDAWNAANPVPPWCRT